MPPSTHLAEILFDTEYGGAAFSGPGRFESEVLQVYNASQANPSLMINGVATKTTLSQDLSKKESYYADAYYPRPYSIQSHNQNQTVAYLYNSANLSNFDGYAVFSGNKLQKLYTKTSRNFVTYYRMVAKDNGAPTTTYKYWTVSGSPGNAASYPGSDVIGSLVDVAIQAKWKVYG